MPMESSRFRRELENHLAPHMAKFHPETCEAVREMIDFLCRAFEKGGIEGARRFMERAEPIIFTGERGH